MKMEQAKSRRTANSVLLLAYAALAVTLLMVHEPWRDEAQQWLFVRNQSFLSMLSSLHYEGHPALWYLLLWPLTRLGGGYFSVFLLHAALVLFGGWLIAFRSPFRPSLKFFFLFSYALGYQYNAVARSYSLVCVLLFLTAAVFPQRYGRYTAVYGALLFLLINTHLLAALIAAVLIVYDFVFLLSRRIPPKAFLKNRQTKSFLLIAAFFAAGMLLFYLTLRGPRYFYGAVPVTLVSFLKANLLLSGFKIFLCGMSSQLWSALVFAFPALSAHTRLNDCVTVFNTMAVGLSLIALLAYRCKAAFLVILFCFFYALANVAGAPVNYWNAALVFVFFIFSFWISETTPEEFPAAERRWEDVVSLFRVGKINLLAVLASLSLLVGTGAAALAVYGDIRYPYSQAKEAAAFIREKGYDTPETALVSPDFIFATPILPYLRNVRCFSLPGWSDTVSYSTWDEQCVTYAPSDGTVFNYARGEYYQKGKLPLVVCNTLPDEVPPDFVCVYDGTEAHAFMPDETYCIYTLRQCAGG